jgi:propanol-preferring alcohol dehydrogenase
MNSLQAMCLAAPHEPLRAIERPMPAPGPGELLLRIEACGVCRTDLHLVDGELPGARYPLIPGHEIVARVESSPPGSGFAVGQRVGVPWLGWTCGKCRFCVSGRENLCNEARFTGCQIDGGYANFCVADARYCFALPENADPVSLAPLLCAGLIGYRALRFAGEAHRIGLFGFGAAAHIVAQVARDEGREVYAFTRAGDAESQAFALSLGATWAGSSSEPSPAELDAALIFAPVGALVPAALRAVGKGGCVVCAGIHMSDIPSFPYAWLWGERQIRSVANLTRADGDGFFADIARHPPRTHTTVFPLSQANEALQTLREGLLQGAAVLVP